MLRHVFTKTFCSDSLVLSTIPITQQYCFDPIFALGYDPYTAQYRCHVSNFIIRRYHASLGSPNRTKCLVEMISSIVRRAQKISTLHEGRFLTVCCTCDYAG
jgi:hypothetical protein